ncbi:hypothetical protein KFL_000290520 [Klebsormidium nitens]|uniref:Amidase domain-containing protein n=1 Tax=Klebsormidium nitens TaxID=105231 RepID=A0A1Y1HNT2_KLENI|nr:hypothetical protein KFL_000290520 [Klebsormidium nitens]|eukprot:GAQ79402.1 hypothetical protein KFL_000290520 [Klebsormidium nitens]
MLGYVLPFSVSCNPVVAMPLALVEGVPCGIQVVGRSGADEELLSACALLETCLGSLPRPEDVKHPRLRTPVARL